jgi:protein-glutamine gamma-glutamyltransferase
MKTKAKLLAPAQIKWLLVSLGLLLATHALNLPAWVIAICVLLGAWRYICITKPIFLPNRWLLVLLSIILGLLIVLSFKGLFGRDASLSLLVIMTALKLLETRSLRDYMLCIMLGFFLIGNLFLFDQSMVSFGLSIAPLLLLTAALVVTSNIKQEQNNQQNMQFIIKLAGKLLLQSLPIMLVLFVLFPRIPGPLWGIPQDAYSGMTGLGDNLQFGSISQLTKNSSIAFRVQFQGAIPAKNQLYWRGPVLWHQEEYKWLMASDNIGLPAEQLTVTGMETRYTITLEPHNRLWLLLLDMPSTIPANTKRTHDYSAVANEPVRSRIRYDAVSYTHYQLEAKPLNERERIMALQITEGENPRTRALAQNWLNLAPTEKINNALTLFRNDNFVYTLKPPLLGKDPVDQFLFNTKKGFCEHYATSFVYLMRAAGLPARIVTGYQGGELNPNGNYLIVRQSDAHAWAEVWLENQGWVRIDPTAAVSPERIEQGIGDALRETDELPMMARHEFPLLKKAFLNWDNINNGWNQWVLGYDDKKQLEFLSKLSGKDLSLYDLVVGMILTLLATMAATAFFVLKKAKIKLNPAEKVYAKYLKQIKSIGLQPNVGEGVLDFGARAALAVPQQKTLILDIASRYNALQYGHAENAYLLTELELLIEQFNPKF